MERYPSHFGSGSLCSLQRILYNSSLNCHINSCTVCNIWISAMFAKQLSVISLKHGQQTLLRGSDVTGAAGNDGSIRLNSYSKFDLCLCFVLRASNVITLRQFKNYAWCQCYDYCTTRLNSSHCFIWNVCRHPLYISLIEMSGCRIGMKLLRWSTIRQGNPQ